MNLRSEGTNPRALGTNPRARARTSSAQEQSSPAIITNAAELRDFLAQFRPKRKARRQPFVPKKDWQGTLRQAAANTERRENERHGGTILMKEMIDQSK